MSAYDRIGDAIGTLIFILGWSAVAAGLVTAAVVYFERRRDHR